MKIVLFILTLYMFLTQFTNIKTRFKSFKDRLKHSVDAMTEKNKTNEALNILRAVMFIIAVIYSIIVFNVVQVKVFQIIVYICFLWSMFDLNLYIKLIKGEETKIMNSRLYSVISFILDSSFYVYIIYYIILNW